MKKAVSIIGLIGFLLAVTLAMLAGCSSQKEISKDRESRKALWSKELKENKITLSEYCDLIEDEKELEQIEKLSKQK